MANLDLIPDPQTLVIQGALFGAAAVIVKNKFVKPYLALREKKDGLTSGSKANAEATLKACDEKTKQIETKLVQAFTKAQTIRSEAKQSAQEEQRAIVNAAEAEAKAKVDSISAEILSQYKKELEKLPETVKKLTDEFYNLSVN
ncbi:MAG: hypothetical protein R3B45_10565 [Bdellovibrionota bacterium]